MIYTILENRSIADRIYDMRLEGVLPHAAPGRFVHVLCPEGYLRRPISICGADEGTFRLVYAVKGGGTQSLARLRPGAKLDCMGALGNGFPNCAPGPGGRGTVCEGGLCPPQSRRMSPPAARVRGDCNDAPTLLVGGGVGVPPMLYCAAMLPHTHALLGFRTKQHVILADEFPSCDVFTDDGSFGAHGNPIAALRDALQSGKWARVFACGPTPLLRATADVCAETKTPCFVSLEERMGCGVGACLVCACAVGGKNRRVCKDGPVFAMDNGQLTMDNRG